jgi:hypothetical protein
MPPQSHYFLKPVNMSSAPCSNCCCSTTPRPQHRAKPFRSRPPLLHLARGGEPKRPTAPIGNEPMVVKYDIRWADAGTNSFPEENNAPTIDATTTRGDADEAEGDGPVFVWADGSRISHRR